MGSRGDREDQAQRPDKTVGTKLGRDKNGGSPRGGWQERGAEYPAMLIGSALIAPSAQAAYMVTLEEQGTSV